MKAKKWILLILVLLIVGGGGWYIYKITHKPVSEEEIPTTDLDKAKVGDVVVLGTYDKDNNAENGEEPLLWKVMAEEDGKLLLASYYGIECLQYNHYPMDITWEECTLRSWLNDEFYNNHFTDEERSKIILSHLENHDNYRWGTDGGNDTDDYIFLFSIEELTAVSTNPADQADPLRELSPTEHAVANRAWYSGIEGCDKNCVFWWTRSPGPSPNSVACVMGDGSILEGDQACYVSHDHYSVRPVLWIQP